MSVVVSQFRIQRETKTKGRRPLGFPWDRTSTKARVRLTSAIVRHEKAAKNVSSKQDGDKKKKAQQQGVQQAAADSKRQRVQQKKTFQVLDHAFNNISGKEVLRGKCKGCKLAHGHWRSKPEYFITAILKSIQR